MDLENTFYLVGIVYMSLLSILLLMAVIILFQVIFFIKNAPQKVEETVSRIIEENKGSLMGMAGMAILTLVVTKMKGMFGK